MHIPLLGYGFLAVNLACPIRLVYTVVFPEFFLLCAVKRLADTLF